MILRKELKWKEKIKKNTKEKRETEREKPPPSFFTTPLTLLDIVDNYFLSPWI